MKWALPWGDLCVVNRTLKSNYQLILTKSNSDTHTSSDRHSSGVSYETVKCRHWNKLCIYTATKRTASIQSQHWNIKRVGALPPEVLRFYKHTSSVVLSVKHHRPLQHAVRHMLQVNTATTRGTPKKLTVSTTPQVAVGDCRWSGGQLRNKI